MINKIRFVVTCTTKTVKCFGSKKPQHGQSYSKEQNFNWNHIIHLSQHCREAYLLLLTELLFKNLLLSFLNKLGPIEKRPIISTCHLSIVSYNNKYIPLTLFFALFLFVFFFLILLFLVFAHLAGRAAKCVRHAIARLTFLRSVLEVLNIIQWLVLANFVVAAVETAEFRRARWGR